MIEASSPANRKETDSPNGSESQAERAYQLLRRAISSLELGPNEPLSEAGLAQRYGLGRSPIREAVQRLRHDGLVVSIHRRGLFVSSLSLDDVRELYDMLEGLDGMIAYLAAERDDPAALHQLRRVHEEAVEALARGDHRCWQDRNFAFHRLLVEMAGNRRLQQSFDLLHDHLKRALLLTLPIRFQQMHSMEEHQQLIGALAEHDAELARRIAQGHRRRVRDEVLAALRSTHLPSSCF